MSRRPGWWEEQECFPKPGTKLFSVKNALFCLATGPPSGGNIPRIDLQAQYNTCERILIQLIRSYGNEMKVNMTLLNYRRKLKCLAKV